MRTPFYTNWVLDKVHAREFVARSVPEDRYTDFEWAAVERHFDGLSIEAGTHKGWAWFELDPIDPSLGANRAERDALRLTAVLLGALGQQGREPAAGLPGAGTIRQPSRVRARSR